MACHVEVTVVSCMRSQRGVPDEKALPKAFIGRTNGSVVAKVL